MRRGMILLGLVLTFGSLVLIENTGGVQGQGAARTLPTYPGGVAQSAAITPTPTMLLVIPRAATPTLPQTPAGLHPLTIAAMRQRSYPGSDIVIESTLDPGSNYDRYIASYQSEGLKIYALLTVPRGDRPATGWPAIVFNHGYIPPDVYRTTERYVPYIDAFARNGYVVIKPDYRGHDRSEGAPTSTYGAPDYVVDVLNAFASIRRLPEVDPARVGLWGHSMGGYITLRAMVINPDIRAGVIWAGVVGSYPDLLYNWRRPDRTPPPGVPEGASRWRDVLVRDYGTPEQNPDFWASISANSYLESLSGPVQLHHGTADEEVPVIFSQNLATQIETVGGLVELYTYPGDDHNIATNLGDALSRSVRFFDVHVKGVR